MACERRQITASRIGTDVRARPALRIPLLVMADRHNPTPKEAHLAVRRVDARRLGMFMGKSEYLQTYTVFSQRW